MNKIKLLLPQFCTHTVHRVEMYSIFLLGGTFGRDAAMYIFPNDCLKSGVICYEWLNNILHYEPQYFVQIFMGRMSNLFWQETFKQDLNSLFQPQHEQKTEWKEYPMHSSSNSSCIEMWVTCKMLLK